MYEEKKVGNLRWVSHNNLKFRIHKVSDEMSVVWASVEAVDLCFTLLFYDFIGRWRENHNIELEIDTSWQGWKGFKVKNIDMHILLKEIINFVIEWKVNPNQNGHRIPEEKWFSV